MIIASLEFAFFPTLTLNEECLYKVFRLLHENLMLIHFECPIFLKADFDMAPSCFLPEMSITTRIMFLMFCPSKSWVRR